MISPAGRVAYLVAVVLDAIGAAAVLLIALRPWQVVTTVRPAPLPDDTLRLSGRTVDAAPTAFALVALAGVVAIIATRGLLRRIVGAVIAVAGAGLVWRSIAAAGAVSAGRARTLVTQHHRTVTVTGTHPRVAVTVLWPALSIVAGVLVLIAGVLVASFGHRWLTMSARYETAATSADGATEAADDEAQQARRSRAAATLWSALDRGEDPTDTADTAASPDPRPGG